MGAAPYARSQQDQSIRVPTKHGRPAERHHHKTAGHDGQAGAGQHHADRVRAHAQRVVCRHGAPLQLSSAVLAHWIVHKRRGGHCLRSRLPPGRYSRNTSGPISGCGGCVLMLEMWRCCTERACCRASDTWHALIVRQLHVAALEQATAAGHGEPGPGVQRMAVAFD